MKKLKSLIKPSIILLGLFLLIVQSCNNTVETRFGLVVDTLELADQALQSYIDEGKLPGISALILKDGEVAHQFVSGYAHIDEDRLLDEHSIYRIYSMSKPITAAALMMLYDEGKFQLDDQVSKYIPMFEKTTVWVDGKEVEQVQPFTIRNLLTHTAGFCYGWEKSYVDSLYSSAQSGGIWANATLEDMMKFAASIPLKHQPGTKYEYSISIDVAGYLVEVLSGMPFDKFLQKRLFGLLGMDDSGFEVPETDHNRLAMIYTMDQSSGKLMAVPGMTNDVKGDVSLFSGGGGMVSTIGDYGRFGQMLLNGGELDGVRVLQESTVHMITSDQMPAGPVFQEGLGYGLGGYVDEEKGLYGWSGMASTDFLLDMNNNMIVLSFTQYVPFMGVPYADEFKKIVESAIVKE